MNEPCRDNKNDIINVVFNFHALGGTTVAGLGSINFDRPRAIGLQLQPPPDTTAVTDTATGNFHRRQNCLKFSVWSVPRAVVFTVTGPRLPAVVSSCRDSLATEAECNQASRWLVSGRLLCALVCQSWRVFQRLLTLQCDAVDWVETATRGQHTNKRCHCYRSGHITASRLKDVSCTNVARPSQWRNLTSGHLCSGRLGSRPVT